MQLVTDHVSMYDSMKDRQIGVDEVVEKFGVEPEKMIDLQSLAGDSTDNSRRSRHRARRPRRNCWRNMAISTRFSNAPPRSSRTSGART
jgi:hypothetical protein